jgi:hypothetical protein
VALSLSAGCSLSLALDPSTSGKALALLSVVCCLLSVVCCLLSARCSPLAARCALLTPRPMDRGPPPQPLTYLLTYSLTYSLTHLLTYSLTYLRSHFLPRIELIPEKRFLVYPDLMKAVGSQPLGRRVDALRPDVHLFGHSHFGWVCARARQPVEANARRTPCALCDRPRIIFGAAAHLSSNASASDRPPDDAACALIDRPSRMLDACGSQDTTIDGVRYVQAPLATPAERTRRPRSLSLSGQPELPMKLYDGDAGRFVRPMRALWSDHYERTARTPDETFPAPWVVAHYASRAPQRIRLTPGGFGKARPR